MPRRLYGFGLVEQVRCIEVYRGAGIVRQPPGQPLANEIEQLFVALVGNQGPLGARAGECKPQGKNFYRYVKVNGQPAGQHEIHVVEVARRATAASHNHVLELGNLAQGVSLDDSEPVFAATVEYLPHCGVVSFLDVFVEVDEFTFQLPGKLSSERTLAAAHVSYQENRSVHILPLYINSPKNKEKILTLPKNAHVKKACDKAMANKFKWYVVWVGDHPGIYDSWEECKLQVERYPGARYKSFSSREEAVAAFRGDNSAQMGILRSIVGGIGSRPVVNYEAFPEIISDSLAVDAACSGNPGVMEYRGVWVATGEEAFHKGPFPNATNNIGEFLAIVHGLALLKQMGRSDMPIYSDSRTGQAWVRDRRCKTTLQRNEGNAKLFEIVERAERWLENNTYHNRIIKWNTEEWGEIPADFGRK